jgi:hypothetical protein
VPDRQGDRARSGAHIDDRTILRQPIEGALDKHLGLGPRDEYAGSHRQLEVPKSGRSDHVLKGFSPSATIRQLEGDALDVIVPRDAALGGLEQPVGLPGSGLDLGRSKELGYLGAQLRP